MKRCNCFSFLAPCPVTQIFSMSLFCSGWSLVSVRSTRVTMSCHVPGVPSYVTFTQHTPQVTVHHWRGAQKETEIQLVIVITTESRCFVINVQVSGERGKDLKRLGMLAGLLFSSLIAGSLSKFTNLQPGAFVKTLGQDCKLEKFKVGPESSFLLESANFLTEYAPNLACKEYDSTWHNELINILRIFTALMRKI